MKTLYVKDRSRWRAWLEKNSQRVREVWLVHYKRDSGRPRIAYADAVEEAICFGWIDGKIKKLDEARYAQRYTPRKPDSKWSELNIRRAEKLIQEGKMTPAGRKVFDPRKRMGSLPVELLPDLEERFKQQAAAWENFISFPPSYRRMTIGWVASAKKQETRLRRVDQLIVHSLQNKRIKFM